MGRYVEAETSTAAPNPSEQAPLNELAVLAFVLAFVMGIVGAVLGVVALHQITKTGQRGRKLAMAAIVIGSILAIAFVGVAVAIFFSIINQQGCTYPC
ncbi:uncharacterized protein DUF4190 [Curtobacterium flaccumfaciens]|uniref:Uncharacterized protein DUF4190 n=1 Tax=Curtobacterium flaccumfaciens TaxID=2035 RepID=A0A4R6DAJ1_9MICO|nr:DUF4190 domain-containing protein [Curtobacterium flaccumfaciens]TDN41445.1 uncharacterized protein DUF4190 [Curtobacterium flaccumfaciens]